ncbi:hypothetical protein Tco_0085929 [Tanacetum coccineum]
MCWVIQSDAVLRSCDAVLEIVVTASRCMTRSSTKELFTPFKNPEREFRSFRKLFKTLNLDESRSPVYDLFSDLEENSKEEFAETMNDHFELKGQFLKELRDNTFSGSDHEDANEHIEKVLEIVDLFHIPNITQDLIMLRAFPMSLTGATSRWLRNKLSGSIKTWEDLKAKNLEQIQGTIDEMPSRLTEMQEVILFYNGLEVPTRQILDSKGAIPTKTASDAKVAIQEMATYSNKWKNGASMLWDSTKGIMQTLCIKNEDNQWKSH